jgi:hypothetical protein
MRAKAVEALLPWEFLAPGESRSGEHCPFCNGGDSREKSFSVERKDDGKLVYFCHRAKCSRGGALDAQGSSILHGHAKTKVHKTFNEKTEILPDNKITVFEKVYGLTREEIINAGFLWVPERNMVYHPVRGPDGVFRGQVLRNYVTKEIRTYKAFPDDRRPCIAWFPGPKGFDNNEVVIVEDILSALKFSRYHNAVALLGSSMSNEALLEIMQWSGKQYLALDKDAITTALKIAIRWSVLLDIQVIQCERDPKYWSNVQLERMKE